MSWAYVKSILRAVRQNLGRFLAIFGIITLGVGFVAGLWATTPDMRYSLSNHFASQNAADVFIKATVGLTEDDLAVVAALPSVEQLLPTRLLDAVLLTDEQEVLTARIFGLPWTDHTGDNPAAINRLELLAGRWPEAPDECLMERGYGALTELPLGSTLRISPDDNQSVDDTYAIQEFSVVGIVRHPFHFSIEREPTNVGAGYLDAVIYVAESCFALDVYTDFYLTLRGSRALTVLTDEYEALIDQAVAELEQLGEQRSAIRHQEIMRQGQDKLAEARAELADARRQAEEELAQAWQEIEDGWQQLKEAREQLDAGWAELAAGRERLEQERAAGEAEIAQAELDLAAARQELLDGERQLAAAEQELAAGQEQWDAAWAELQAGEAELQAAKQQFDAGEAQYREGLRQLEAAERELAEGERQLAAARAQLEAGEAELREGRRQVAAYRARFEEPLAPLLAALREAGLPYSSVDDLFQLLEEDPRLQRSVDGVLQGIRWAREQELDLLEAQLEATRSAIAELEQLLADIEAGERELPPGTTLEMLEETLERLREHEQQLVEGRDPLEDELAELPGSVDELLDGWHALREAEAQLDAAEAELAAGWRAYHEGQAELENGRAALEAGREELAAAGRELEENRALLQAAWAELEEGRQQLEAARQELEDGWAELERGKEEISAGWEAYYAGLEQLAEGKETLAREIAAAEEQLAEGAAQLEQGELEYAQGVEELAEGEAEYFRAKAEVERQLAEAEQEIVQAEADLLAMGMPQWYVLDKNALVSFATFAMNTEKVDAIATVFPAFFLLVAALVSLTSMMRMVEEERVLIGTLKALGYSRLAIMGKYLGYSCLATGAGSLLGLIIGFPLVPYLIWGTFGTTYSLNAFRTPFWVPLATKMTLSAILLTALITYYACNQALKERPAALMRPRSPRPGQRILLERITFIWRRLKFSHKSTARNLFRYKRHFFMTVLGVAGCTALLVTGFGLRDTIRTIAETQFQEIFLYDLRVELRRSQPPGDDLLRQLDESSLVEGYTLIRSESGLVKDAGGKRYTLDIYVPTDLTQLDRFIHLRQRVGHARLDFAAYPVVMTEKLAEILGLKPGDTFRLENSDGKTAELALAGICENYVGSAVYLSPDAYREAFGGQPGGQRLLVQTAELTAAQEDELSSQLLTHEAVLGTQFLSGFRQTMDRLLSGIDFMVLVIILAAGALAMIVLFNLININVAERMRELATLRVLGYHHSEVEAYIFRETTILAIIGTLAGLPLGRWLLMYIIHQAESADLMFGREITSWSYLAAAAITILFSRLVMQLMKRKIRGINMAESMKAVE
ncbi:MAG: FtsX-like permease family protein [Bacillota bacterium]